MAAYILNMTPTTGAMGNGEKARGDWIIKENNRLIPNGEQPAAPRWELSQVMGTAITMQATFEMVPSNPGDTSQNATWGFKLRIKDDGSFLWVRIDTDAEQVWILSYSNGAYTTVGNILSRIVATFEPHDITVSDDGDLIYCNIDGVDLFEQSVAFNSGETRHGIISPNYDDVEIISLGWADYAAKSPIDLSTPVIARNGAETVTVFIGDDYVEQGATAEDPDGNALAVTITDNIDTSTEGYYTVTYSATYQDITV